MFHTLSEAGHDLDSWGEWENMVYSEVGHVIYPMLQILTMEVNREERG